MNAAPFFLGGDAIGPDSSATDDTGGFTAVEESGVNLGQPAISVTLSGFELLNEFRVIVFGLPAANGNLRFDDFQYQLNLWKLENYLTSATPEYEIDLGTPEGIVLVPNGPKEIIPSVPFGTAGIAGGSAATYDFRFDLTTLPISGLTLESGDWVLGFQSSHDTSDSGILRVSASGAGEGPLPMFSREGSFPPGVFGSLWGITLTAEIAITGDFDLDFDVDDDDGKLWAEDFGKGPIADANEDGDVDGADFLSWQTDFGLLGPMGTLPSDFVPDGVVDVNDLVAWYETFGAGPFADADHDKDIDGADYLAWQQNFGAIVNTSPVMTVPEPNHTVLILSTIFSCCWRYLLRTSYSPLACCVMQQPTSS